jgi:glycosyltransferase involved in cell wall biosynthesis
MMNDSVLSVCITIGEMRQRAERSLSAVLDQELDGKIEVVVIDTRPEHPPVAGADDPRVVVVPYPDVPSYAHAKLRGLAHATAPYVAFVEDHAFVQPGWAAGVLKGFATGADVVVYTYLDATPHSIYSRAFILLSYGRWMSAKLAGEREHGPPNNVAYRMSALKRQGDDLEALLKAELFLHRAIREQGGRVYQEATAKLAHANWNDLAGTLSDTCSVAWVFAQQRVILEDLSLLSRWLHAAAMPLLPAYIFVRYSRTLRKDPELLRRFWLYSPLIMFVSACTGATEAMGYISDKPGYKRHLDTEVNVPRACDPQ